MTQLVFNGLCVGNTLVGTCWVQQYSNSALLAIGDVIASVLSTKDDDVGQCQVVFPKKFLEEPKLVLLTLDGASDVQLSISCTASIWLPRAHTRPSHHKDFNDKDDRYYVKASLWERKTWRR